MVSVALTLASLISSTVNSRSLLLAGLKSLKSMEVSSWKSFGKLNRDVGCCPGLIQMQYAVLHFVWRSTEFSTFSINIVDGFGEGTVQLFCGSASFVVVASQSAYAITVACASCPACI